MKPMYTAAATAEAGRNGRVWSDDKSLELPLSMPKEMGGDGSSGTNPEELFAAGYAACFHSAMMFIGGQKKLDLAGSQVKAAVSIGQSDAGPGFELAVTLSAHLPNLPQDDAAALVDEAHKVCPYSNATRGNVDVALDVQGQA
ncbi:MAG: organic hydroperoxide resistance protein [Pseudomonadota bacterium]